MMAEGVHNPFVPKKVPSPEELAAQAKAAQTEVQAEQPVPQRLRA